MAVNVSVQNNAGFLPDILLLTVCYYHHRGRSRLNAMKSFCPYSLSSLLNVLKCFAPDWLGGGWMLRRIIDAFVFSLNPNVTVHGPC